VRPKIMKIAIAGATGFIGSHLAGALAGRGHAVTCLARSPARLRWIQDLPVRIVFGDVSVPHSLDPFAEGQDVIIDAAGLTKARTLEELVRVNVAGTLNLLAAARSRSPGLRRFFYLSSQEAMGPNPDERPLTEDAEQKPFTRYGRSKAEAEKALRGLQGTVPVTVIRPPGVYGPRDRDFLALFRLAARGIQPVFGLGNTVSIVYVKSLVEGICLAIERPVGSFRSYFFTDGEPLTQTAFTDLMALALGRRALRVSIPPFVARAVAAVAEAASAVTGRAPLLNRENLEKYAREYWIVSDERARVELDYRPLCSTAQGIRETAAWYREQGWV
jgi:nucleoside-diphosphate-sugar epimerase